MFEEQRILILCGNFGSGKSEIAINTAFEAGAVLVDMDVVNPYFRSSNRREDLEAKGLRVVAPPMARTSAGLFTLPADIAYIFDNPVRAVIDVGGDAPGATALGRFRDQIAEAGYRMNFVLNARRPRTDTAGGALEVLREVESASGLRATGIINNTNLVSETTADDVLFGQEAALELCRLTGLPLVRIYALKSVALPEAFSMRWGKLIERLTPRLRPTWLDETAARRARTS